MAAVHLDHLVIAARDLGEGVAWLEARLGVPVAGGGRHEAMGTHNRLLSLGPGRYIEVIAIDPAGITPARPRWFDLDSAAMRERLERGPALVTWAVRSEAIEATAKALGARIEILPMARGTYRWRIGVAPSGALAQAGTLPTILQWETEHPTVALTDSGCRLEKLLLQHPAAAGTLAALHGAGLPASEPVETGNSASTGLVARLRTPAGIAEIRG
jgi:hypothetical protein